MIGMAVRTGNLWRFPRIIGQYGGAAFIIPFIYKKMLLYPLEYIRIDTGKRILVQIRAVICTPLQAIAGVDFTAGAAR